MISYMILLPDKIYDPATSSGVNLSRIINFITTQLRINKKTDVNSDRTVNIHPYIYIQFSLPNHTSPTTSLCCIMIIAADEYDINIIDRTMLSYY